MVQSHVLNKRRERCGTNRLANGNRFVLLPRLAEPYNQIEKGFPLNARRLSVRVRLADFRQEKRLGVVRPYYTLGAINRRAHSGVVTVFKPGDKNRDGGGQLFHRGGIDAPDAANAVEGFNPFNQSSVRFRAGHRLQRKSRRMVELFVRQHF